jgi:hypothetical protein
LGILKSNLKHAGFAAPIQKQSLLLLFFIFFLPQQTGLQPPTHFRLNLKIYKLIVGPDPLLNGQLILIFPFCTRKIVPQYLSPNICHHKIGDIFLGTNHSNGAWLSRVPAIVWPLAKSNIFEIIGKLNMAFSGNTLVK